MRLRQLLLYLLWMPATCCYLQAHAQKPLKHQVSLVSENDNYSFTYADRYYTNGMMLKYVRAGKVQEGAVNKLFTAELGHQIFTPYRFNLGYRRYMDRPFTGYLYLRAMQTRFYQKGGLLQLGAVAGVIGEKAFGKEVQRWHHRNFGLKFPYGWETGLKTGLGLNLEGRYVHPLLKLGTKKLGADLQGSTQAQVGNLFVQGGAGLMLRAGAVQAANKSAAYDARILATDKKIEWYFYYEPQVIGQAYNATLQGTLGQHAHHIYTTEPEPIVTMQRVGFVFAPRRWTLHLAFAHKSKEATTMRDNENWGTVAAAFRW